MNQFKKLSVGQQVLFMFGTLCAILTAIGAFFFLSLRSIDRSSHEQHSYVVNERQLVAAASQGGGLMQAVIFRHILASDPSKSMFDNTIAPTCALPR